VPAVENAIWNIYSPAFDTEGLQSTEFMRHGIRTTFKVHVAILLHLVTLGIFTTIFYGFKHSELPKIRPDDFSAGRAIGFLFIPIFNIYWFFVFWLRLADRINLQFRLRSQPPPVSKEVVLTALVITVIPYLNLVSFFILVPYVIAQMQSACNRLALEYQEALASKQQESLS
jgi:hypothetical protein